MTALRGDEPGSGVVAIVAGSGQLPTLLARSLEQRGRAFRLLALRGFADRALQARADAVVDLLDVRGATAQLDRWQPSGVTLVGGVSRPGPSAVLNAFEAFRNRHELGRLLGQGDDQLLRAVLGLLEEHGHRVVGVHDLAPDLLAPAGIHSQRAPTAADRRAIEVGLRALAALSPFDVGQAVVVSEERVLGVEGPEGTDRLLARVRGFRRGWSRVRVKAGGVLVKAAKASQDLRIDLPAIGARTMVEASRAGLDGVAIGAGASLILDLPGTAAMADRLGLFLVGAEA